LQEARDEHGFAIAYGIDVERSAEQILVDQNRAANAERQGGVDVTPKVISRVHDLHASTAEHVRRPNQHGIADPTRDRQAAVDGGGRTAGRLWDPVVTEQGFAAPAVLGEVDSVDRRPQDADAALRQRIRQVESGLTAELDDNAQHRVTAEHVADAFQVERLEIKSAGGVEIGTDGLGIAIDEHAVETSGLQCGRGVHAAVVELDPLADPYWPRPEHRHGSVAAANDLVLGLVGRVVIRRGRLELSGG